jgi:hypothetical protein
MNTEMLKWNEYKKYTECEVKKIKLTKLLIAKMKRKRLAALTYLRYN